MISVLLIAVVASGMALAACSSDEPEDVFFALSISDGALNLDPPVMKVEQGDTVTLNFSSDEHGSVHLHGYDEEFDVGPDEKAILVLKADATGSFNLTFHPSDEHVDDGEEEPDEDEADEIQLGSLEVHPR
jgi:plastocyanin